ncbi:hypothetical protein THAOC_31506, partial [Thalassiosira oceanica]
TTSTVSSVPASTPLATPPSVPVASSSDGDGPPDDYGDGDYGDGDYGDEYSGTSSSVIPFDLPSEPAMDAATSTFATSATTTEGPFDGLEWDAGSLGDVTSDGVTADGGNDTVVVSGGTNGTEASGDGDGEEEEEEDASVYGYLAATDGFGSFALALNTANLVPLLSSPNGTYAVFAPTDAAFSDLPGDLTSRLFTPAWAPQLRDLLLYHVVEGGTVADDGLLADGEHATMNYGGDPVLFESVPFRVNGQELVSNPTAGDDGAAYPIGAVLAPPSLSSNVVQVIAADGRLGSLVEAAVAAGLEEVLAGDGPLTVFAPTDEAFESLPDNLLEKLLLPENKDYLDSVLSYHVLPANSLSSALEPGLTEMLNGELASVQVEDDGSVTVNGAGVVTADLVASNGIVHVIDEVLITEPQWVVLGQLAGPEEDDTEEEEDGGGEEGEAPPADPGADEDEEASSPEPVELEPVPEPVTVVVTKRTATVKSSLKLAEVAIPEDPEEKEELIVSLEDSIASIVAGTLGEDEVLEEVNIISIGGQPVGQPETVVAVALKRARVHAAPKELRGLLRGRSLQALTDVEFEMVINNLCAEDCEDKTEDDVGDEILSGVTLVLSDTEVVQEVLQESGNEVLLEVTVEEVMVEEEVEVTSDVETIVIMSNETDSFAVNARLKILAFVDDAGSTDSSASQAGSTPVDSVNATATAGNLTDVPLLDDLIMADSNSTLNTTLASNTTDLNSDGNSDADFSDSETEQPEDSSDVPSSVPSYFPSIFISPTVSPTESPTETDPNACRDDLSFVYLGKSCASYLATGRPNVLKNRCENELDYGLKVQDYCRKTCSNCPPPVPPSSAPNPQPNDAPSESSPADQMVDEPLPDGFTVCEDHRTFEFEGKSCAVFLDTARQAVLKNRCEMLLDNGKMVQDYCILSCGICIGDTSAPTPQPSSLPTEPPAPTSQPIKAPSASPVEAPPDWSDFTVCANDPTFELDGLGCDLYLSTGRPSVLKNRCEKELDDGYRVQDYCRLRCDNCRTAEELEEEMEALKCVNHPKFRLQGENCIQFLSTSRPGVLESRCERELENGYKVQDYCRLGCEICLPEEETAAPTSQPSLDFTCKNDPTFEVDGKGCDLYLSTGRPTVLKNRCERELDNGKMVQDYCRLRCDNCLTREGIEAAHETRTDAPSVSEVPTVSPTLQPTLDFTCKNDPTFEFNGRGCDLYLSTQRPSVLKNRCERELDDGKMVQDYCRLRCDNCLTREEIEALHEINSHCKNDPTFELDGIGCDLYLSTGRPTVLKNRCERELDDGKMVQDYCRLRCDNCPTAEEIEALLDASTDAANEGSDSDEEGSASDEPALNGAFVDVSLGPNGLADEVSFPSDKTDAAACPMTYRPVCSTDGLVFSNDCIAGAAGKDVLCTIEETDQMTAERCTCELSISNITTDFEAGINSTFFSNSTELTVNETNNTMSDAFNSTLEVNATGLDGIVNGTLDVNFTDTVFDDNSTISLNETLSDSELGLNHTLEANATSLDGFVNGTAGAGNSTANLTITDGNLTENDWNATLSDSDYGNSTGAELNTTLLDSTSLGVNETGKLKAKIKFSSIQCTEFFASSVVPIDDNTTDLNGTMDGDGTSYPADSDELATVPLYESLQSFIGESEGSFAGSSVVITPSGDFIAVGSRKANSPSSDTTGMVRVYRRGEDGLYAPHGADLFGSAKGEEFGSSVSISDNGNRIAVGSRSSSVPSKSKCGAISMFEYDESTDMWLQLGNTIEGLNTNDRFGYSISMSALGLRVAAGAPSTSRKIGSAMVFEYTGTTWIPFGGVLKDETVGSRFGGVVSLSGDGGTLAVGALSFSNDETAPNMGSVSIYRIEETINLSQNLYGSGKGANFGYSASMSRDGQHLAVGARGFSYDDFATAGMCEVYDLVDGTYISAADVRGTESDQQLGLHVAMSSDGSKGRDQENSEFAGPETLTYFELSVICSGRGQVSLFENDLVVDNFSSVHEDESFNSFRSCSDVSDGGDIVIGTSAYKSYTGAFEIFRPLKKAGDSIIISPGSTDLTEGAVESVPEAGESTTVTINWRITSYDNVTVRVGDSVEFVYEPYHDVYVHPTGDCSTDGRILVSDKNDGRGVYNFTEEGTVTFACDVADGDHCRAGQIVHFHVLSAADSDQSASDIPADSGNYTDASTSIVDNLLDYVFLESDVNDQSSSRYGFATALTDDGRTLVVGAPSAVNNDGQTSGAIFVYSLEEDEGELQGVEVEDEVGETLVVMRDILQNEGSNSSVSMTLQGVIFGASDGDEFGSSVDMSSDGSRIIVGSRSENDQSGAVRVYEWFGDSVWDADPVVFAGSTPSERAGWSVSISGDGNVIAYGSPKGGDQGGGSVTIYGYDDESGWLQLGSAIQGSGPDDMEGYSLSLSHDGSTLVTGAPKAANKSGKSSAGRARIFNYDNSDWAVSGDLDGEDAGSQDGSDVAISLDGSVLVVGGKGKSKKSQIPSSGHCLVFELIDDTWQFQYSMKGQESEERLGSAVAISSDMTTVACGGTYGVIEDISKGVVRLWNRKTSTRNSIWPHGGDMQGSMFGHSISFSRGGKHIIVGAPAAGAVQLFHSMSLGVEPISTAQPEHNTLENLKDEGDLEVENDVTVMNEM